MLCLIRLKKILQYNFIYIVILLCTLVVAFLISNNNHVFIFNNYYEGKVISKKIDGNKVSMTLKQKDKVNVIYYVKDIEELKYFEELDLGITIKVYGSLMEINNNTIPNTFNYKEYLKHNNIKGVINVDKYEVINNQVNIFYKIKNGLRNYIKEYESKDYLETFIIGKKEFLDEDTYHNYQQLGVSHIFAISGMHITLLTAIILKLLSRVKENIRYIIVIIFLLFYLFLTDYTASVSRSITLFIILYLNRCTDLNLSKVNCYLLSLSILLIIRPYFLYDIGFLYSSIISFSLIKYSSILKGNYLLSILKVSVVSFIFGLPITIMNNYEINIFSIINNLFFVPLISLIVYPLSLITLIVKPLDILLFTINNAIEYISRYLFILNIIIPKMNSISILIYYCLLILFMKTRRKIILVLMLLIVIIPKYTYLFDNNYYIYFFDVGQGDSSLIRYKDETILIDTGGKTKFYKEEWMKRKEYHISDNIISFMKSIGIEKLDYLIITHGDYDHMGEAINLVENFKVEKVIFNCGDYNNLEKELIKVIEKKSIEHYSCIKELDTTNNKLYFLNTREYNNENDNSNVIYTELNNYKFLFMGDASTTTEKEMLNKYNLFNIDVLKVGHHGSKTSSGKEFISMINPKNAVISVGKNNRYGHPNKEILDNLNCSKIYRTDQDGSIMFKINKNRLKVDKYMP